MSCEISSILVCPISHITHTTSIVLDLFEICHLKFGILRKAWCPVSNNQPRFKKTLRLTFGFLFLVLGLLGLLFPLLQGWLFLALGAILLSSDVPFFNRVLSRIKSRFPVIGRAAERLRKQLPGQR